MGVDRSAGTKALYMFSRFQNKTQTEKKKLSTLSGGIHKIWWFSFLEFLHSFRMKIKFDLHKKICENKDYCDAFSTFQTH